MPRIGVCLKGEGELLGLGSGREARAPAVADSVLAGQLRDLGAHRLGLGGWQVGPAGAGTRLPRHAHNLLDQLGLVRDLRGCGFLAHVSRHLA